MSDQAPYPGQNPAAVEAPTAGEQAQFADVASEVGATGVAQEAQIVGVDEASTELGLSGTAPSAEPNEPVPPVWGMGGVFDALARGDFGRMTPKRYRSMGPSGDPERTAHMRRLIRDRAKNLPSRQPSGADVQDTSDEQ